MTRDDLNDLAGAEKTRARIQGLTLALAAATEEVNARDLSADQRTLIDWAVQIELAEAARLLICQTEPDHIVDLLAAA